MQSNFKFKIESSNDIISHQEQLRQYVYRWRGVSGDGNCFYRAVIFGYIENIIISRRSDLMAKLILDFNDMFEMLRVKVTSRLIINQYAEVDPMIGNYILNFIYTLMTDDFSDSTEAVEVAIKSFNFNKKFDKVRF